MLVAEAVEDPLGVLAACDDAGQAQFRQMLGDRSRGLPDDLGELPTDSSVSCRASTIRIRVGSASMEKTSTARSMYSAATPPRWALSAFMRK